MELFFDTETNNLPLWKEEYTHPDQPHVIQFGFILSTDKRIYAEGNFLVTPQQDFDMSPEAERIHGISKADILLHGIGATIVADTIESLVYSADCLVAHNMKFDLLLVQAMLHRAQGDLSVFNKRRFCTMLETTDVCCIPGKWGKNKWPKLQELHKFLFGVGFEGAHDALEDVRATRRCFYELQKRRQSYE